MKKELTKAKVIAKIKAMGEISPEQKKEIVCTLVGHSKIIEYCFGYVHCGRCGAKLGDTLAGVYGISKNVIIGHKCPVCVENAKTLTWKDKYLTPNPFK